MATEVIMPKVDMDQEAGTVMEWVKRTGDPVEAGETILVIETDKVAVDVEAPASGTLAGISAEPGEKVPIGTVIAYVLEEGEEPPREVKSKTGSESAATTGVESSASQPPELPASPLARKMAASHGIALEMITPTGAGQRITKEDVERALSRIEPGVSQGKVYAVPAARRLAAEHHVDLGELRGSGPGGRIQSSDVMDELEGRAGAGLAPSTFKPGDETIPLQGIRRTIAERMTRSYQTIPHIRLTIPVEMDAFAEARTRFNDLAQGQGAAKVSATALMVKLLAGVLQQHPLLNSSLSRETILLHQEINIGVAVALETGLIVPVVKAADRKSLAEIAELLHDLTERARSGELKPSEVKGGTFTVSNLGPFGVEQFDALINPPEAAILAIGSTQPAVVPAKDGSISVRSVMRMTLSADHRIIDGAVAARFLADLRDAFQAAGEIQYAARE